MKPVVLTAIAMCGASVVLSVSVAAQWPKRQTPGVPRDAQGKVRLDAPPPRTSDGKPDFSGMWTRADRDPAAAEIAPLLLPRDRQAAPAAAPLFPPDRNSPPLATFWELGANVAGGLPFTPWALDVRKQRVATAAKDNPDANCMPMGFTQFHMQPQPRTIVQTPRLILIEYEANYGLRHIYMDGRTLPKQGDPQPWWYGYSVGRWDGDTLVVETNNVRGADAGPYDGWLDVRGSPYSDQAIFTERVRRPIFGKLEIDVTLEDAKAYTRPFTIRINQRVMVDEDLIEFVCNENQQFRRRVKID